jgi:hypothetical protein
MPKKVIYPRAELMAIAEKVDAESKGKWHFIEAHNWVHPEMHKEDLVKLLGIYSARTSAVAEVHRVLCEYWAEPSIQEQFNKLLNNERRIDNLRYIEKNEGTIMIEFVGGATLEITATGDDMTHLEIKVNHEQA